MEKKLAKTTSQKKQNLIGTNRKSSLKEVRIVITGGPSGGKTTLVEILEKNFGHQLKVAQEAASVIYRGGFPRKTDVTSRFYAQRAIYAVQKELEDLAMAKSISKIIVCDRGRLDSVAYWPGSEQSFFKNLGSDRTTELGRYDWIIHLDTASNGHFDTSNPIRVESQEEALILNQKIRKAWRGHPQRIFIPHCSDFMLKMKIASLAVEEILNGRSYTSILEKIQKENAS